MYSYVYSGRGSLYIHIHNSYICKGSLSNGYILRISTHYSRQVIKNYEYILLHSTTSTETVWDQLSDNLQWKSGNTYIPKGGQHLVCFVDDLHEAKVSNMYHVAILCHVVE